MSQGNEGRVPKVYSIQVSGIKCTNCAGKIKKGLGQSLSDPDAKIAVNIIQQKVSLTVFKESSVQQALEILGNIGFPAIGQPVAISGGDQNHRNIAFLVDDNQLCRQLEVTLASTLGVQKATSSQIEGKRRINIVYNCEIVKGKELAALVAEIDGSYGVINDRINSFSNKGKVISGGINVEATLALCFYFFIFDMIMPAFLMQLGWYDDFITFPSSFGIYSLFVLVNFAITMFVMVKYAKGFVVRATKNYCSYRVTNMETLIAMGSVSAFCLFLFFMGRYTIEFANGELQGEMAFVNAIMDINDALTSSAIIVLVVTIGKYFESKAKQKIEKMTQQIFPESTLFRNMKVQYVQIKNRQLKIVGEQQIDASLVQKNDVIRINPGRLLLDVIVIQGTAKAMQSARTGCEDIISLNKGERIESGSEIRESSDCLAIVENVLQKSLLIEIGTQVKLSQNQEENQESGIQAVCKTIANYFVKGVILLSLLTIITWSLLLHFFTIDVPMCNVCWVVERGIGVLVASCPCALGLAVPSVIAIILNLATKSGILIKNNGVFEKMKKARTIAFDKTGTLFTRINKISEYVVLSNNYPQSRIWEIVALIEKEIRHPLAEVLYKEAFTRCDINGTNFNFILLQKPQVQKEGISVKILEKGEKTELNVFIGNRNILSNNKIAVPTFSKRTDAGTQIFLAANGEPLMVVMLNTHSNLRPEAKDVITKVKKEKLQVHILSGDSADSVEKLGEFLGIPQNCQHPEQSTFNKMKWIKDVQQDGKHVAIMIGDGLNDIPCLQEAGIGISINAKSQLNINAADVVILSENLHKILALIRFLRRGNLFINLNLFWAFAYNLVMLPIVTGAFFPLDIFISPVWSSIAMSASSLFVVGFSHLLSLFEYDESLRPEKSLPKIKMIAEQKEEMKSTSSTSRSDLQLQLAAHKMVEQNDLL